MNLRLTIRCYFMIFLGILLYLPAMLHAENITLTQFDVKQQANSTHIHLSSNQPATFKLFSLKNPDRVVLDIEAIHPPKSLPAVGNITSIAKIRSAAKDNNIYRIVFDMAHAPLKLSSSQPLSKEKGQFPLTITIEHAPTTPQTNNTSLEAIVDQALNENIPLPTANPALHTPPSKSTFVPNPKAKPSSTYKPIIIIDAGHGGHDPGSIGRRGTKEKSITLAFAKELHHRLKATGKYTPILTRSTDRYITLRGRVAIARKYKADLFISLHADSHNNPHVKGMSVYTLSDKASDKEAAALARKENKSDIIAGIDLKHEDQDITNVLISIAQRDSMNQSSAFAEEIVSSAKNQITLLRNPHRFAGFRVLTAADIPSVLVELGYLSNRREEKLLTTQKHKKQLVQILINAINAHF